MQYSSYQVEQFVLQNYQYLTAVDMAEELDISVKRLRAACDRLQIKPLGAKEKLIKYILVMYKRKTKAEIAEKLKICPAYAWKLYDELNIEEPTFEKIPLSVGKILSRASAPSVHYHPEFK